MKKCQTKHFLSPILLVLYKNYKITEILHEKIGELLGNLCEENTNINTKLLHGLLLAVISTGAERQARICKW